MRYENIGKVQFRVLSKEVVTEVHFIQPMFRSLFTRLISSVAATIFPNENTIYSFYSGDWKDILKSTN